MVSITSILELQRFELSLTLSKNLLNYILFINKIMLITIDVLIYVLADALLVHTATVAQSNARVYQAFLVLFARLTSVMRQVVQMENVLRNTLVDHYLLRTKHAYVRRPGLAPYVI